MEQIFEGIDNEVALLLFFTTTAIAFIVPLYVARIFYPRHNHGINSTTDGDGQNTHNEAATPNPIRTDDINTTPDNTPNNAVKANTTPLNVNNRLNSSDRTNSDLTENIVGQSRRNDTATTTDNSNTTSSTSNQQAGTSTDNTSHDRDINTGQESHHSEQRNSFLLKVKVQETTYEQYVTEDTSLLELKRYVLYQKLISLMHSRVSEKLKQIILAMRFYYLFTSHFVSTFSHLKILHW